MMDLVHKWMVISFILALVALLLSWMLGRERQRSMRMKHTLNALYGRFGRDRDQP